VLIVIAITNIWFLLVTPVLILLSWLLFSYSVVAYRENTRIEAVTKSPLLILLGETFTGASTIRAFGKSEEFVERNFVHLNQNGLAFEILIGGWSWYGTRMSMISGFIMIVTTVSCFYLREDEDPIMISMLLSYTIQL